MVMLLRITKFGINSLKGPNMHPSVGWSYSSSYLNYCDRFDEARGALLNFRERNDATGFPKIRNWLAATRTPTFVPFLFAFSKNGDQYHMLLTKGEYERMKSIFLVTEAGKNDTWSKEPW